MELEANKQKTATHTYPLLDKEREEGEQVEVTTRGARYFWHTRTGDKDEVVNTANII